MPAFAIWARIFALLGTQQLLIRCTALNVLLRRQLASFVTRRILRVRHGLLALDELLGFAACLVLLRLFVLGVILFVFFASFQLFYSPA